MISRLSETVHVPEYSISRTIGEYKIVKDIVRKSGGASNCLGARAAMHHKMAPSRRRSFETSAFRSAQRTFPLRLKCR
jgi:hypothetical protein